MPLASSRSSNCIVSSTGFTITGSSETYYLEDDGAGAVNAYYISGASKVYLTSGAVGTVDYTTGDIVLTSHSCNMSINSC